MHKWEARLVERPWYSNTAVYVSRLRGDGAGREYLLKSGDVILVSRGQSRNEGDDPIFAELDDEQLQALSEAINKSGYKAPNEHVIEGKLNATERHLDDMRSLVFGTKKQVKS